MATRTASPARDEARHWLPSQGVDPAPLAELNAECLGLLAMRAAAAQGDGRGEGHGDEDSDNNVLLPPLLSALRGQWAALSAQAVRRLAAAPFTLFDAGFGSAPRWLELRSRGVSDQQHRCEPAYFELAAARSRPRCRSSPRCCWRRWCCRSRCSRSRRRPRPRCGCRAARSSGRGS